MNKRKDLMQYISKIVCAILLTIIFVGCEELNHPIAGHTYVKRIDVPYNPMTHSGSIRTYVHFSAGGNFDIDYAIEKLNGYEHNKYDHFKWSVKDNDITITYDYSTTWKSSVRGTVAYTGFYDPSDNTVTLESDGNKSKYEFLY